MKALIFFDINGTIIKRDDRTDLPFTFAINNLLGIKDAMVGVDTTARSDQDVFIEVLEKQGKVFSEVLWQKFLALYEVQLNEFYESDVWRENADACGFIKKLHDKGYYLSLITGELKIGAAFKLKKLGLWKYFKAGGFGEDGLKRFDIADAAKRKADLILPTDYQACYVIGDTVLDIQTARHLKAKVISIATGSHSMEQLKVHKPDFLIHKFSEIENLFL